MGIPREFPFPKWRFLVIPRNSHTGEVYWLCRGGGGVFTGGIVLFTGRRLFIAPPKKSLLAASKPEENGRQKRPFGASMNTIGEFIFPFCIAILRIRYWCLGEKYICGPQFSAWGSPLLSSCDRLGFPKLPGIPGNPWEFPGILGIPKATLQNREFPSTNTTGHCHCHGQLPSYCSCGVAECIAQHVADDKKAWKRPTLLFLTEFPRFPREPPD